MFVRFSSYFLCWSTLLCTFLAVTNAAVHSPVSIWPIGTLVAAPVNLTCHGQTNVYSIRESPGRGLGVFAIRDLEPGDIIIREAPIVKISPPDFIKGTGYPLHPVGYAALKAMRDLDPWQTDEAMSPVYHASPEEKKRPKEQRGDEMKMGLIFRTNAYKTGEKIGLFPRIARINHSCRPNASYYWNVKLGQRVVFANQRIKRGEEIFDSYISLLMTREERQRHLDVYGFRCGCEACAVSKRKLEESDERRTKMRKLFDEFANLSPEVPNPYSAAQMRKAQTDVKDALELLKMIEKEGLKDYEANAFRVLAITHGRARGWREATLWANKGYEMKVKEDPESAFAKEMYLLTERFVEAWKEELRGKGHRV